MAAPVEKEKAYTILKITELVRGADVGGLQKFYRHQIKTAGGVVLTVDVDAGSFTPKEVAAALLAAAKNADAILTL